MILLVLLSLGAAASLGFVSMANRWLALGVSPFLVGPMALLWYLKLVL